MTFNLMNVLQQSLNCMEIQRLYYIDNITGSIHDTVHSDDVVAIFLQFCIALLFHI